MQQRAPHSGAGCRESACSGTRARAPRMWFGARITGGWKTAKDEHFRFPFWK